MFMQSSKGISGLPESKRFSDTQNSSKNLWQPNFLWSSGRAEEDALKRDYQIWRETLKRENWNLNLFLCILASEVLFKRDLLNFQRVDILCFPLAFGEKCIHGGHTIYPLFVNNEVDADRWRSIDGAIRNGWKTGELVEATSKDQHLSVLASPHLLVLRGCLGFTDFTLVSF